VRIRAAEDADAAAAAALWTEAYSGAGKGEGRVEPYSVAEFNRIAAAGMLLVAVDGRGALLGVGAMRPPGSPGLVVARPEEAELGSLAVSVWARGGGVGRALAGRCLELAAATGAARVALWSRPYQVEAHRLYESLGFRRAPRRDESNPDGRRLVFTSRLAPDPVGSRA
jgi:ribosomal protein S18 acetylase RimI-like enzyme